VAFVSQVHVPRTDSVIGFLMTTTSDAPLMILAPTLTLPLSAQRIQHHPSRRLLRYTIMPTHSYLGLRRSRNDFDINTKWRSFLFVASMFREFRIIPAFYFPVAGTSSQFLYTPSSTDTEYSTMYVCGSLDTSVRIMLAPKTNVPDACKVVPMPPNHEIAKCRT